jgi:hypothetical protein
MDDVTIYGWWQEDIPPAPSNGEQLSFGPVVSCPSFACLDDGTTFVGEGAYYEAGARWPAKWQFEETNNSSCGYMSAFAYVQGPLVTLECTGVQLVAYSINPTAFNPNNPPATVTVSGPGGFTASYGMPLVQYYDPTGTLQGYSYATSVSSDGTSITGPPPNFSSAPSGTYVGVVLNADPNYNYDIVGAATVYVGTNCP